MYVFIMILKLDHYLASLLDNKIFHKYQ